MESVSRIHTAGGAEARSGLVERLRRRIRAIEQAPVSLAAPPLVDAATAPGPACPPASPAPRDDGKRWTFGAQEIDRSLPEGALDPGGLHEIRPAGYPDSWAAIAMALALLARRRLTTSGTGVILWGFTEHAAHEFGAPYGPGILCLGIDPADMIMARAERGADLAWALEEGLKSRALCAALGVGCALPPGIVKRLALAARTYRTPCLLVPDHRAGRLGPALTRWRVAAARSADPPFDAGAPGLPAWDVTLERCRHGAGGQNRVLEWDHETHRFRLAAPLADRTADDGGAEPGRLATAG
jgi:protein ImuA